MSWLFWGIIVVGVAVILWNYRDLFKAEFKKKTPEEEIKEYKDRERVLRAKARMKRAEANVKKYEEVSKEQTGDLFDELLWGPKK